MMDWIDWTYWRQIIAAAIVIPAFPFVVRAIWAFLNTSRAEITLQVPPTLLATGISFGLLHIRDGTPPDTGQLLNKEILFKPGGRAGALKASVRYKRRLGFQFKCFADYKNITLAELKQNLQSCGCKNVSEGEGKSNRAWFPHPNYALAGTNDSFLNNFYYPS